MGVASIFVYCTLKSTLKIIFFVYRRFLNEQKFLSKKKQTDWCVYGRRNCCMSHAKYFLSIVEREFSVIIHSITCMICL